MRRIVVGVMGGAEADAPTAALAHELGRLVAREGWVLLNGGRCTGVMEASARGARDAGGLTVGILFDDDPAAASAALDIVIPTGLGAARNSVNVLASEVVFACRGSGGTLSEVALALRFGRPVILVGFDPGDPFLALAGGEWYRTDSPAEAVAVARRCLQARGRVAGP